MAVVLYSEELGVYLGECMGLGFWSKLDPVGQAFAVTFESEDQAWAHTQTWDDPPPADARLVAVQPDDGTFASVAACVQAGLPGWQDSVTPVANTLPC